MGNVFTAEDNFQRFIDLPTHVDNQLVVIAIECKPTPMMPLVSTLSDQEVALELIEAIFGIN